MNYHLKITGIFLVQLVWACTAFAQTEQGWFGRNWHDMNARFNGLYHAQEILNESVRNIKKQHVDDFNQVLDVFPYGNAENGSSEKASLEEVYKKASKLIRRHPKSKWVDDSWFLIGKAYFFQYDAYASIETFQYVVNQYPEGERLFNAKLWIVMAYLQQGKYYDAEAIMALLNQEKNFPRRLTRDKAAISAEIYIKQGKYVQAIRELERALTLSKVRDERSRYHFILGQLHMLNNSIGPAKENFAKTISLNPPYELAFQSNLGLIKAISMSQNKSLKAPRKHLKKMLKDDKNIEYFDQIYYQLGSLELKDKNKSLAIDYFRLSAASSSKNQDQKANAYLALATLFFEDKNYSLSQKYFDSTAMFMSNKRPDYEQIKAKQLVLTDLIENLVAINEQDSLLQLASMSREQLDKFIEQKIQESKALAEKIARDKENQQQINQAQIDPFEQPKQTKVGGVAGDEWYFYNLAAVGRGSNDFKRRWGDRPMTDHWRIATLAGKVMEQVNTPDKDGENKDGDGDPKDDPVVADKTKEDLLSGVAEEKRKYYEKIPFSEIEKKAANNTIINALFLSGKIYEEDLKELDKAKYYFELLLKRYPGNSLEAETYFHLYKIAKALNNEDDAKKYADLLNEKYPKTPFNLVINNRDLLENMSTEKEVSQLYVKAYDAYLAEQYDQALQLKNTALQKYAGNALQAKFDYLHALIIGKTQGEEAYITALQRIKENYPGTLIANTAIYTLEYLANGKNKVETSPTEQSTKYAYEPESAHYFITLYDGGISAKVLAGFSDYNAQQHSMENLKASPYLLAQKNIVAIQTFKNKTEAEKYYIEFIKNDQFFKSLDIRAYENFTISADNFRILLNDPNSESYSEFFFNNYIQ